MIKRFEDYEKTQAYTDVPKLPKGAYILKIMGASVEEGKIGQYIKISCDIAEGEYTDFFTKDYRAQQSEDKKWHCHYILNVPNDDGSEKDGWTKRRFKTVMNALEDSNSGFHFDWDETKLKGLLIGGLFNIREYEYNGKTGSAANLKQLVDVKQIKEGTYKLPDDQLLNKPVASNPVTDGFLAVPDTEEEALPF